MIIANRSIHIIDYENNRILSRDIPATFDEYVGELIEHINRNDSVRDYKTRSRYTEVISGAIAISSQKDNADVVRERTNSIANRLLVKEVEAQGHIGRLNTNVQKGSLIQALLFDEQEHKHVYLLAKVEHSTFVDDVDFSFKTGFSKDKKTIWKSCLIDLPPEESDEYYAKGLLSDVDLQESFNGDKIITDTVRSVERGIWIYTIIWFVFLIVLLLILEHISSSPVITIWINNAVSFFHEIAKSGAH